MIKKVITFFVLLLLGVSNGFAWVSLDENIFQEEINKNFKSIDDKAELFLDNLNKSKNYCFGPNRQMTFVECSDYIEKVFSINSDELVNWEIWYAKACENALVATIQKQKDKAISAVEAKIILAKDYWSKSCSELYKFKLSVFKSVAYDILKKNKYAILRDEHKKYTQKNRTLFDDLLDGFRVSLSYIERLWKGWTSKTKK